MSEVEGGQAGVAGCALLLQSWCVCSVDLQGVGASVTLAGFRSDKRDIYESGSLLCSVSRYEGFPLSLCEAAAYGLPVVAFDCP